MAKILSTARLSKKEIICRKAAVAFRQKGYTAGSMRELAELIGVEAPSLYNHIGSKSEILQEICFYVAEKFTENVENVFDQPISPVKKLEKLIRFHTKMMLSDFDRVYVANSEWKHLPEPYLEQFLQQRRSYEHKMVQIVKEGIHAGEIRKTHPHITVLTILSAVRGLEYWYKYKDKLSLKIVENNIVNHLLKGIVT